ncbi:MAG: cache domain-containing protein, partial [Myxococcales bacterium]
MRPLRLQAKLVLAFTIVLLPVLMLVLVDFYTDLRNSEEIIVAHQLNTTHAVAELVEQVFNEAIQLGETVAASPAARTMDPSILDPYLQELIGRSRFYDAINVFGADGVNRGWGNVEVSAEPRLRIGDRPYFQQVLRERRPVVSEVILLRRPLALGVIVGVPIVVGGETVGVVNVVFRTDLLAKRFGTAYLRPDESIFLVDPTGRLAFHTRLKDLGWEQSLLYQKHPAVVRALAGSPTKGALHESPVDGSRRYIAVAPTRRFAWAV